MFLGNIAHLQLRDSNESFNIQELMFDDKFILALCNRPASSGRWSSYTTILATRRPNDRFEALWDEIADETSAALEDDEEEEEDMEDGDSMEDEERPEPMPGTTGYLFSPSSTHRTYTSSLGNQIDISSEPLLINEDRPVQEPIIRPGTRDPFSSWIDGESNFSAGLAVARQEETEENATNERIARAISGLASAPMVNPEVPRLRLTATELVVSEGGTVTSSIQLPRPGQLHIQNLVSGQTIYIIGQPADESGNGVVESNMRMYVMDDSSGHAVGNHFQFRDGRIIPDRPAPESRTPNHATSRMLRVRVTETGIRPQGLMPYRLPSNGETLIINVDLGHQLTVIAQRPGSDGYGTVHSPVPIFALDDHGNQIIGNAFRYRDGHITSYTQSGAVSATSITARFP